MVVRALCFGLVACAAVTACSGDGGARVAIPGSATASPSRAPGRGVVVRAAPAAKMSSGAAFEPGVLSSWCDGEACERDAEARPLAYVPGTGNGVLVFQVSRIPDRARVEIADRRGRVVTTGPVAGGTTMAYGARLGRGRFVVTLVARFGAREGRWVFGLLGPLGDGD